MGSFFRDYIAYVGKSESPDIYHRWTAISLIASLLGRRFYFPHGHFNIYPNMYIMLQGLPGVRKSTAISIGNKLLKKVGYTKFASNRMSRQMFLEEMYHINQPPDGMSLDAALDWRDDYEISIHASEFLDFIGQGDKDYLMLITSLWDNLDEYKNPKLTAKSVVVNKPTVNFIGGNTPAGLNMAFPSETIDSGTLSRFIFIHAAATGKKVLIPSPPNKEAEAGILERLTAISKMSGQAIVTEDALAALEVIYDEAQPLDDPRFQYYFSRRLTHVIKLCLIVAASRLSYEITAEDVLIANTMLGAAEYSMPKALGHFGRNRNSAVIHSMLEFIEESGKPIMPKELYNKFCADFARESEFISTLMDLQNGGKIVAVKKPDGVGLEGLVVQEASFPKWLAPMMMVDELTRQERATIGL